MGLIGAAALILLPGEYVQLASCPKGQIPVFTTPGRKITLEFTETKANEALLLDGKVTVIC